MLVGICLSGQISSAQDKTAAGVVTSYSLSIEPISGYNTQGYGFRVFYSTYDGIANNDLLGWYNDSISYEAMPTTPGSGTYRTDFAICDDTGSYFNRGTMTFTIPATDSDGNGCPDALQVNKSYDNVGNASSYEYVYNYNGTGSWDYYGTLSPTFTFSRSAGSSVGRIIGSEYDPTTGATSTFSGYFNVEGGTGTAIYNATTRAITFAGNSFSFGTSGTGSSTFTRISDNQVSVAQFNFIASDGSRTVKAFTLNRTGNYYRAYPVELLDGDPSTSYVDFRYCHVEILDNNDTDGDGIPDLSDANSMINQAITFSALSSKTYGDSSFSLTGSASSGLSLSYSSSNTGVATVSGSVVTIVGAGSTTITASQPGNSSYNAATSVSQALTVSKASQTISFTTLPAKTYGDSAFALTASSTSGLSVSYSSSNPSVATVAGSTVTIVAAGTATITATQAGNSNYNPASSVFQNLSVSRATLSSSSITLTAPSSLVYNGSLKSYTASASGVSGFSYTYSGISTTVYPSTTTPPKDVGYYSVTATSTDVNYAGSINGVKFTIIPLPVTVTAAAKTKGYGSLDPVLTYTSSGLLGTDAFTGSLTRAAGEVVGSYNILIGTLSAGSNYSISYIGASLAITANYLSWASSYGLSGNNALQSADPDNDGSNNAYEFAFYGNPLAPGSRSVSASVSTGGIKYVWFQRKDISQVTYTPKTGNDLATAFNTWSTVQSVTSNPQPIGIDSNYEQVEVVLPTSLGKGFLKVQADVR
jgi:hypothetical protein